MNKREITAGDRIFARVLLNGKGILEIATENLYKEHHTRMEPRAAAHAICRQSFKPGGQESPLRLRECYWGIAGIRIYVLLMQRVRD